MLAAGNRNFFFEQKRRKRFQQRRVRKFDESAERREGITFLLGEDATSAFGEGGRAPSLAGGRAPSFASYSRKLARPGTASHRVPQIASLIEPPGVNLPPVDPNGPHLVTAPLLEEVETRSIANEKKLSFLLEVEAKLAPQKHDLGDTLLNTSWSLTEAKFASTGILSKLSKTLTLLKQQEGEITVPEDLVEILTLDHRALVADTVVEKREWQTDCYLDYKSKNIHPFLTSVPDEQVRKENRAAVQAALTPQQNLPHQQQPEKGKKKVEKHVRMSNETKNEKGLGAPPERPHTARSIMSNFSFKSEPSEDGRESTFTTDYDRLPAELRPTIPNFRRESLIPKMARVGPQTRLERMNNQVKEKEELVKKTVRQESSLAKAFKRASVPAVPKKGGKSSQRSRPGTAKASRLTSSEDTDNEEGQHGINHSLAMVPKTTINFSVEKTNDNKQEWLVHPSDSQDPEGHTIRMWDKKLKELHRKREESLYMDKNRGADRPMVVKFYNEAHIRTLRMKHQRSATVPLPTFFSKLPPSVCSFSSPAANEALMIGEGVRVFVLTLPDGSGYCNYMSGQQAISQNRCDVPGPLQGSRGLYTMVFDDVPGSPMLAYFTPTGKACCYYQSGAIRMLSDSKGGRLYNEDGVITKKWEWPPHKLNLPVSVSIYLNVHISLRCTGLTSMDLRVSTRGHSYKFPVGPLLEDLDNTEDLSTGNMQSTYPFISKAAKSHVKYPSGGEGISSLEARRMLVTKRKSTQNLLKDVDITSNLQADADKLVQQLDAFRGSVSAIVTDWMKHYCKALGITDPSQFFSPGSRPDSRSRGVSSRGRLVKSSMDHYFTGLSRPSSSSHQLRRTRSLTHPLNSQPSSRPISPFRFLPAGGVQEELTGSSHGLSPLPSMRPVSPLDFIKPPSPTEHRPFRTGKTKPTAKSALSSATGCPIALHNQLWKNLDSMPPCKCDKRKVPYIRDLEYDVFLLSHVPKHQLIIICVTSTLKERSSCACEPMIDAIYTNQNRLRFSPCKQCEHDPFRLIKYNIAVAKENMRSSGDPEQDKPLLVKRHNASPGMFLMYLSGKLVHADYMFNGYSNTKKDFMKQVRDCIQLGKDRKFMPYDFKFTRRNGTKILGSNTWAYPVSGFMQDLVPFSPQSNSQSTTRGPTPVPQEGRRVSIVITDSEDMETETERGDMDSQLTLSCTTSTLLS